ncbi:probable LRR receptor-like serine/threonine-protein kinase PAM74 [Diospyros lotus]|uniref:probable LRR receptor-like serine/threonine-protein kinase PAM74 n=1 Tax=Diospyros lotus TaxID=55363 RepID=UPI002256FFD4|nr:probable LRR receptor-like serine/threonine-protein kinase PAM74 [Diospyros lotus]
MAVHVFLLWLVSIPLLVHAVHPPPRGFLLNCGSSEEVKHGALKFVPDDSFVFVGNKSTIKEPDVDPILSTLRYFPDNSSRKHCYVFPAIKEGKFLIRTTYYYGGFDGGKEPPVFDQIIDGTKWSTVNTTEDYANGLSSYYEIIVTAHAKTLSLCLARNGNTISSPFISAVEVYALENSLYNATDFVSYGLATVARNSFGYGGDPISFPDDQFNRLWQPFKDENPVVSTRSNITSAEFWNMPPEKALTSALTNSRGKTLTIKWPPFPLPQSNYYIALYFQDNRNPGPYSWRVFNVAVNGKEFYRELNVSASGVTVYSPQWPLSGQTEIVLTPVSDASVGPVINAGEIFQIMRVQGRTLTRDVMALEQISRGFNYPPSDWHGDPCLPKKLQWTGLECSYRGKYARVIALNLTGVGVGGQLSGSIDDLTAIRSIWLGGNKIKGLFPNMTALKSLESLHLDNNQLQGQIPKSLEQLPRLRELFVQGNNLEGTIPTHLGMRTGMNLQYSPGNEKLIYVKIMDQTQAG